MKVVKEIEVEVEHCFMQCPHFTLDPWPEAVMVCTHPKAPQNGFIITHPKCDHGFPALCPLINYYE